MQKADDMVFILVADGVTRHAFRQRGFDVFIEAVFKVQANHVGAGHHDFAGTAFGKVKNVIEIGKLAFVDIAVFIAFFHQNADFFFVMRFFRFAGGADAHAAQCPVGNMV